MKQAGITTSDLQKHAISAATIKTMKEGGYVTTKTLNKLCSILDCTPADIIEHIK
jgi:DNA-binding Xre family transcriptional regulator